MTTTPRRPSMTDVAARAGVSYQTVSRVLNEPAIVRPETRERVLEAITALGYARNRAARALKTTRSSIVGVLSDGSSLFGPAETTTAIERAAREAGYATLLATAGPGDSHTEVAAQLVGSGADGIIVVAGHEGMIPAVEAAARTTPVVAVSSKPLDVQGVEVVGVDQARGARDVIAHLSQQGVRSILHAPGPPDWFDASDRREGVEDALEALGVDGELTRAGDWSARSGHEIGTELARGPLPDAIFAANDLMAIGILRALREAGREVPRDVALVGFDDIGGAAYSSPSLTTVAQPFAELGRTTLHHLLATLDGDRPAAPRAPEAEAFRADEEQVPLPPRLVVRESSVRPD
jgi:DNA-binding LacI/PurR family transcriptional regulator